MTYANRGPQHSGQSYSYSGASHSKLSPEEQQKAERERQKQEQQNKQEKARHEKYAVDREKGIFHPGDPQTKTRHVSQEKCDAGAGKMPQAEMERRLNAGLMPPEMVALVNTVEQLKDPANQLPPVYSTTYQAQPTPQAAQTKGSLTPQAETPKVAQKTPTEAQPGLSRQKQRWQLSGTKAGETITVTQDPQRPDKYSYKIQFDGKPPKYGSLTAKELAQVDLHGGDGRDIIALIGRMPEGMKVYGDGGNDSVLKTEGNETLAIDGGKGVDQMFTTTVQATNRPGFDPTPETPVQQFQRELKENARSALQSNRDRLKTQEQRYQDPNPNSPQWQSLWQAVSTRQALDQKRRSLSHERERIKQLLAMPDALPKKARLMVSEAEYLQDPVARRYEQLSGRLAAIPGEIEQLKHSKLELEYEFPALSAIAHESKNTRENNQAILGRIPQKFGEIRHSIDDLDHQIQNDPKVALRLDKVVERTLAAGVSFEQGNGSQEMAQVNEWLKTEGFWKNAATGAGVVATGIAGVASLLNPEVGLLRWGAVALGFGTAAAQLPDALIDDRAAQAQRGGAQQVTSLDPDTARGNLVLGGVNVVLAGLDVGLQPEVLKGVTKIPALTQLGVRLSRENLTQVMRAVRAKSVNNPEWMEIVQNLRSEVNDPSVWEQIQKTVTNIGSQDLLPKMGRASLQVEASGLGNISEQGSGINAQTPMRAETKNPDGLPVSATVTKKLAELKKAIKINEPGSGAHRQARWELYKLEGGEWEYQRWLNTYEANLSKSTTANEVVNTYQQKLGWGKTEVTVNVEGSSRRLDIADIKTKKGLEIKKYENGYISATEDIRWEIERDANLVKNKWDITWVLLDTKPSQPLLELLKNANIKVRYN
jgi:hypothetical protein